MRATRASRTTAATCSTPTASSTWPARSSAWAASARARGCILLLGRDESDPLVPAGQGGRGLGARAATPAASAYRQPRPARRGGPAADAGRQRHVPRLAARASGLDGVERDFYVRQLWDGKGSADLAAIGAAQFGRYVEAAAWTLARAHARSGDRVAIAAYLGGGEALRRGDGRVRRALRGPERARLRGAQGRCRRRPDPDRDGRLSRERPRGSPRRSRPDRCSPWRLRGARRALAGAVRDRGAGVPAGSWSSPASPVAVPLVWWGAVRRAAAAVGCRASPSPGCCRRRGGAPGGVPGAARLVGVFGRGARRGASARLSPSTPPAAGAAAAAAGALLEPALGRRQGREAQACRTRRAPGGSSRSS